MSAVPQDSFPPLWRALGLSVAIGYAGLGSYAAFMPITSATDLGIRRKDSAPESDKGVRQAMLWIGARDISIATALASFYYQDKPREMGTVILSGMILCTVDCVSVYQFRGDLFSVFMGLGALGWGWIGWNLIQL